MNVAILTFHNSDNYGSVLQAYALRTFIKKACNPENCEIINYVPPNQEALYAIYLPNNSIKNVVKNVRAFHFRKLLKRRKEAFAAFRKTFLCIKGEKIYSQEEVSELLKEFDTIVCGSDQIWNPLSLDFSEIYFGLDFSGKKIAYAPSFGNGTAESLQGDKAWVKEALKKFDALSVREHAGRDFIAKLGVDKKVEDVLDPTFLLDKEDWESIIESKPQDNPYIFMYSIDYNMEAIENARTISEKTGLPIKVIFSTNKTYRTIGKGIELIEEVSPLDFLETLKNAKMVLSSSFHGVAFSIIFRKNFYALESYRNGKKYEDERIHTILEKLHMTDRIVSVDNIDRIDFKNSSFPNYDETVIANEIESSRKYIVENLK